MADESDPTVVKLVSKKDVSDQKLVSDIKTKIAHLAVMIEQARRRRIQVVFDIRPDDKGVYGVRTLEVTRLPELL